MDLQLTESYTYNPTIIRKYLTDPKSEGSITSSFLHLFKILEKDEDKEGAPIENYDFAGNLPLIISYLYKEKSHNSSIYQELIKLLQVGLSELTKKCRELQKVVTEQEKIKGIGDIPPLIVDTSLYDIDNLNLNSNTSFSNDKSEVTIVHDKKKNYYAIKRFKRNIENSDKQKSILRNVLTYSQLKHYSILPFVGINLYYRTEGRYFYPSIVTKYQKKKSLFDLLFKTVDRFILSDTQKMIILLGVSTALKHLHKREITHGNLKPSNILINSKYEPFVSDFFNSHLDARDPTSIAFIAPEILNYDSTKQAPTTTAALTKLVAKNVQEMAATDQAKSTTKTDSASSTAKSSAASTTKLNTSTASATSTNSTTEKKKVSKYTKEADVYSFGMVAFSVLTSQAPFALESNQQKNFIKMINSGTRPNIPFYVPTHFMSLLTRCWKEDPSQRPTMKEIVDFICESDPLPETDIKEFAAYTKKVRPNYIMPALFELKDRQSRKTISNISDQSESSRTTEKSKTQTKTQPKTQTKEEAPKEKPKNIARNSTKGNASARELSDSKSTDFDEISEAVDLNDAESVYQYALKLKPKSISQSNKYMQICADMGHTKGQIEHGKNLLDDDLNVIELSQVNRMKNNDDDSNLKLNEVLAAHYFKLAAKKDDAEALYLYGRCLYYGVGVKHDFAKAAKYLERSALKGFKEGQYLYALCLEEGHGVPQNIPLAVRFYKKAERNDVISASRHLIGLGANA